jgi:hypothetical protein
MQAGTLYDSRQCRAQEHARYLQDEVLSQQLLLLCMATRAGVWDKSIMALPQFLVVLLSTEYPNALLPGQGSAPLHAVHVQTTLLCCSPPWS